MLVLSGGPDCLEIIHAKSTYGFIFPAMGRETVGNVCLTFTLNARTRMSLDDLSDFSESRRIQLIVGVLPQYKAACLCRALAF